MAQKGTQSSMYMSVPDKIELTAAAIPGGYSATDQTAGDQSQRYMQIPDTITLGGGASSPPQRGSGGMSEGRAGDNNFGRLQDQADEVRRDQPAFQRNPGSGEAVVPQPNASTVELEHRVRTLEDKVQQLTETLQSQGGQVGGVSNFWYVVTFTGWMLAPLVAIFAYRFKH